MEQRHKSQNSCQVSIFMEENLHHSETFSCTNSAYTGTSLKMVTSIYPSDQNNYHTDYGNVGSIRFVFLRINE